MQDGGDVTKGGCDEHPGDDGEALGTADAGHVDQSQILGEERMWETQ